MYSEPTIPTPSVVISKNMEFKFNYISNESQCTFKGVISYINSIIAGNLSQQQIVGSKKNVKMDGIPSVGVMEILLLMMNGGSDK